MSKLPRESLDHFITAIKSLQGAREVVYQTLNIGPPLTALRNTLLHFCNAVKALDLAVKEDGGCGLDESKLVELFRVNKWLAKLVMEVFTNAKKVATKGARTNTAASSTGTGTNIVSSRVAHRTGSIYVQNSSRYHYILKTISPFPTLSTSFFNSRQTPSSIP